MSGEFDGECAVLSAPAIQIIFPVKLQ